MLSRTDLTVGVPVRVQNDLCVDEVPGGYALIQSLAKSGSSCHGRNEHLWLSGAYKFSREMVGFPFRVNTFGSGAVGRARFERAFRHHRCEWL